MQRVLWMQSSSWRQRYASALVLSLPFQLLSLLIGFFVCVVLLKVTLIRSCDLMLCCGPVLVISGAPST